MSAGAVIRPELRADLARPALDVDAMGAEESEGDPLDPEGEAAGVGDGAALESEVVDER